MLNSAGEWRHLEARATDLRGDRNLRGVVLHARDTTDRVQLEKELTAQLDRDGFASHLSEALEMADEEREVLDVIERATTEISQATPMELLLSDSSRANLSRAASNPAVEVPGCPVKSPFSCVAVRRGTAVVFDSSESLNACPQLRGRAVGRVLGRVCAGELHGPGARGAAHHGARGGAARRGAREPAHGPREPGGRPHRHRAGIRENPAAGLDRRPHRPGEPPHRREGAARPDQGAPPLHPRDRRPRQVQAAQRHPRPRGGRPRAAPVRPDGEADAARPRPDRPLGRGGVRHRPARARPPAGDQRAGPRPPRPRRRAPRAKRHDSPPASGSRTPLRPTRSRSC